LATAFSHAFIALAAGRICFRRPMPAKFWIAAVAASAAPDLDVLLHAVGVGWGEPWGHRGTTHSLFFAAALAFFLVVVLFRREAPPFGRAWWGLVGFFFVLVASHGFIDAFTDGGSGIAFFAPFSDERYFMPFQPLEVPPIGPTRMLSERGLQVMLSEWLWIWLPLTALTILVVVARRKPQEPPA
jgi:inner membrane protein